MRAPETVDGLGGMTGSADGRMAVKASSAKTAILDCWIAGLLE
jgi:hypothetical protein